MQEKSEARIQSEFHQWIWNTYPRLRRVCYAVPNGGLRGKVEAARLKSQGVVPGIPDYVIAVPVQGHCYYAALYIEFKEPGASMSSEHVKNQLRVHEALRDAGNKVIVCTSVKEAQDQFHEYISIGAPGTNYWLLPESVS